MQTDDERRAAAQEEQKSLRGNLQLRAERKWGLEQAIILTKDRPAGVAGPILFVLANHFLSYLDVGFPSPEPSAKAVLPPDSFGPTT